MEYWVGETRLEYAIDSRVTRGEDITLIDDADDLIKNTKWSNEGYTIEPLFDERTFSAFRDSTYNVLTNLWRKAGLKIPDSFSLSDYHTLAPTWEKHLQAVEFTKLLNTNDFPIRIQKLEARISEILGYQVIVYNPFDKQSVFHFRVIRPNSKDNNPLHRDVWLPDYKDCINLYIPVAGSNEKSSLIISPGSHHWPESNLEKTVDGALVNGIQYNVPAVSKILTTSMFERPNPNENEVLIFSPYLIHGGSSNLNDSQTRISIEVRLWRK
jgi:hypothetical protein